MFNRKAPYTQAEIAEQIRQVGVLIEQDRYAPTDTSHEALEIAREVLVYMQDSVSRYTVKHDKQASHYGQRSNPLRDILKHIRVVRDDGKEK